MDFNKGNVINNKLIKQQDIVNAECNCACEEENWECDCACEA